MDNNVNPNNNVEQDNTSNVTPNVVGSNSNEVINNFGGESNNINNSVNSNNVSTNTNASDTSSNGMPNPNNVGDKVNLFGKKEEKSTTVIMSKKMSEELVEKRRQERAQQEQYVAVPVSKAKYTLMIIFFIFMFGLIYFLPDISSFISLKKAERDQANTPAITSGLLTCKLNKTTSIFNIEYTGQFRFEDSKLNKLTHITTTTGDARADADPLAEIMTKCGILQEQAATLGGIRVTCEQSGGTVIEKQVLDYTTLDIELVTSAYVEAGGVYPEFKNEQSIDEIEKNMYASGYTCERTAE